VDNRQFCTFRDILWNLHVDIEAVFRFAEDRPRKQSLYGTSESSKSKIIRREGRGNFMLGASWSVISNILYAWQRLCDWGGQSKARCMGVRYS